MTYKHQSPTEWAHTVTGSGSLTVKSECVVNGGGVKMQGGKNVKLTAFLCTGERRGGGIYGVLAAQDPKTKRGVVCLEIDNTDLRKLNGNSDDFVSADEAAIRIMGKAGEATLTHVNIRCSKRKRKSDGKLDWYKQGLQVRDVRKFRMFGGQIIGPHEYGRQADPGGVNQRMEDGLLDGVELTHMPKISDWKTIGVLRVRKCPKIDEKGKRIGMWPDKTYKGK